MVSTTTGVMDDVDYNIPWLTFFKIYFTNLNSRWVTLNILLTLGFRSMAIILLHINKGGET